MWSNIIISIIYMTIVVFNPPPGRAVLWNCIGPGQKSSGVAEALELDVIVVKSLKNERKRDRERKTHKVVGVDRSKSSDRALFVWSNEFPFPHHFFDIRHDWKPCKAKVVTATAIYGDILFLIFFFDDTLFVFVVTQRKGMQPSFTSTY